MQGQEQQPDLANKQGYLPDLYAPKYVFHTIARIGITPSCLDQARLTAPPGRAKRHPQTPLNTVRFW